MQTLTLTMNTVKVTPKRYISWCVEIFGALAEGYTATEAKSNLIKVIDKLLNNEKKTKRKKKK